MAVPEIEPAESAVVLHLFSHVSTLHIPDKLLTSAGIDTNGIRCVDSVYPNALHCLRFQESWSDQHCGRRATAGRSVTIKLSITSTSNVA